MPIISVVIPAYNSEKTIRDTIESVLQQSFKDFELIVIDDGSQDSTYQVVSSFSDPRVRVFSYPNAGVSASRNRGITKANGEFLAFLDADDLWTPDKLEAQLRALEDNPQAAVAYSWTDYIDESGQFLHPGNHPTATGDVYSDLLVNDFLENGSNPLIRREALRKVGGFDESLCGPEDWELFIRLAACYPFVVVPRSQILYRLSINSISFNLTRQEAQCLQVIERAFNQAPESLRHLKPLSIANLYQYLLFRGLARPLERQTALAAARCLWHSVKYDPSLLRRRSRLMLIIFVKIAIATLLPSQQAQTLLTLAKSRAGN
ncbi:MAG: glycosyltransferase [Tolypothrix sp. T3-bin4]|nr:glycosyltransferase [Tolypothrix sp. T3-bin4]